MLQWFPFIPFIRECSWFFLGHVVPIAFPGSELVLFETDFYILVVFKGVVFSYRKWIWMWKRDYSLMVETSLPGDVNPFLRRSKERCVCVSSGSVRVGQAIRNYDRFSFMDNFRWNQADIFA